MKKRVLVVEFRKGEKMPKCNVGYAKAIDDRRDLGGGGLMKSLAHLCFPQCLGWLSLGVMAATALLSCVPYH